MLRVLAVLLHPGGLGTPVIAETEGAKQSPLPFSWLVLSRQDPDKAWVTSSGLGRPLVF